MSAPDHPDDPGGLRLALNWFHTWFGLVLGGLLFVIFWMGSLAVFDREIDRWTMPSTRLVAAGPVSADSIALAVRADLVGARGWRILLPDDRTPVAQVQITMADGQRIRRFVDPATARILPSDGSLGGTGFFYPYHFRINSGQTGLFICAFAAIAMMALCISGVIVHRRIFADFFTLRIVRKPQRTTLDLHNLSGVLTLPFLLMISFTGVAIFSFTYLPSAQAILYGRDPAAPAAGYFSREPAGRPGETHISLDLLRDRAAAYWHSERPSYVQLIHAGDANAYFELRPDSKRTIAKSTEAIWFDAASGALLATSPVTATRRAYDVVYGIHLIQFDHWTLRWLYFVSGLAGCVLIATGLLFWVQSRQKRHARQRAWSGRAAEAYTIAATTGAIIATLGFLIANRLLPCDLPGRESWEVWAFHAAWAIAALHAVVRGRVAWHEHCWVIAGGGVAAAILNAATTETGLIPAMTHGLWHTAGVDLSLLVGAALAVVAAARLRRRAAMARDG